MVKKITIQYRLSLLEIKPELTAKEHALKKELKDLLELIKTN